MVLQSMKASASTSKGFTLVELIVVITILAILGTIGFLSLQGYSSNARDSKRGSDLLSLSKAALTSAAQGVSLLTFVGTSGNTLANSLTAGFAGTGVSASTYGAGAPNYTALGANPSGLKDPQGHDYVYGATTTAGGQFQFAGSLEGNNAPTALVDGNFVARTDATSAATNSSGSAIVVLTADIGKFRTGDTVTLSEGTTTTIRSVGGDGKTITLYANTTAPATTIALDIPDYAGLIAKTGTTNVGVTNGGTDLPY